ncbi:MAG: DUF3179 domain-containing protein [Chloroflexi bacterium]|nr:DUF3179 domain-containing protein [Chloroflexota bacterium]
MRAMLLLVAGLSLAAAACTGPAPTATPHDASGLTTPTPARERVAPDLDAVPPVDTASHVVGLEDVVFDTFDGSFVPLSRAEPSTIRRLRDAIRPIYNPEYERAGEARAWLGDGDRVIGVVVAAGAFAYPVKTLVFREIVNEELDGVPVAVTFCPLCVSGVVFDRRVDGRTLLLGNTSALYDNDMVMYDHQTGSYWHQVSGRAIVGELSGASMDLVPSMMATFAEWRALYPETLVLSNAKARVARSADPSERVKAAVNRGRFSFPISEQATSDRRLPLGAEVLVVLLAGEEKAYALLDVAAGPANDHVGGAPVVVFGSGDAMAAYVARVGGRELTFVAADGGAFTDRETGSTWDLGGSATAGPLEGASLTLVPARRALWFAIAGSSPGVALYEP